MPLARRACDSPTAHSWGRDGRSPAGWSHLLFMLPPTRMLRQAAGRSSHRPTSHRLSPSRFSCSYWAHFGHEDPYCVDCTWETVPNGKRTATKTLETGTLGHDGIWTGVIKYGTRRYYTANAGWTAQGFVLDAAAALDDAPDKVIQTCWQYQPKQLWNGADHKRVFRKCNILRFVGAMSPLWEEGVASYRWTVAPGFSFVKGFLARKCLPEGRATVEEWVGSNPRFQCSGIFGTHACTMRAKWMPGQGGLTVGKASYAPIPDVGSWPWDTNTLHDGERRSGSSLLFDYAALDDPTLWPVDLTKDNARVAILCAPKPYASYRNTAISMVLDKAKTAYGKGLLAFFGPVTIGANLVTL